MLVNRTIDDTYGDPITRLKPIYLPESAISPSGDNITHVWHTKECGPDVCVISPDITRTFNGSYTAASYYPSIKNMSITLDFSGVAMWVFFVNANNAGLGVVSTTLANFTMDNDPPTLYEHIPDVTRTEQDYSVLAYSRENLVNTQHRLVISTTGDSNAYVCFDYAIYSFEDLVQASSSHDAHPAGAATSSASSIPTPTTTSIQRDNTSRAAIVGGSVAGGFALGIVLLLCVFVVRRRRRRLADRPVYMQTMATEITSQWSSNNQSNSSSVIPFTLERRDGEAPSSYSRPSTRCTCLSADCRGTKCTRAIHYPRGDLSNNSSTLRGLTDEHPPRYED